MLPCVPELSSSCSPSAVTSWKSAPHLFYRQWTVEDTQNGLCAKSLQRQRIPSVWTPGLLTLKYRGACHLKTVLVTFFNCKINFLFGLTTKKLVFWGENSLPFILVLAKMYVVYLGFKGDLSLSDCCSLITDNFLCYLYICIVLKCLE